MKSLNIYHLIVVNMSLTLLKNDIVDVLHGRTGEIGDIVRDVGLDAYERAFAKGDTKAYKSKHQRILDILYEALVDDYKDLLPESRALWKNFEPNVEMAANELAKVFNYMKKPIMALPEDPEYNKRKLENGGEVHLYPAHIIYLYDGLSLLKDSDSVEFVATKVHFNEYTGHFVEEKIPAGRITRKVVLEKSGDCDIGKNFKESITAKMDMRDLQKLYGKTDADGKVIATENEGWYCYRLNRTYKTSVGKGLVEAERIVDETPQMEIAGGKEATKQQEITTQ